MEDKIWVDKKTGLFCLIKQHPTLLFLCGYVGVGCGHPWAGKDYNDCTLPSARPRGRKDQDRELPLPESWLKKMSRRSVCNEGDFCEHTPEYLLEVHGGLTFAGAWPDHGADDIWWFGFDCGHAGDFAPGMPRGSAALQGEDYIRRECEKLAWQLAEIAEKND